VTVIPTAAAYSKKMSGGNRHAVPLLRASASLILVQFFDEL
jgi:hypothetical protein